MLSSTELLPAILTALYAVLVILLTARDRQHLSIGTRRWLVPTLFLAGLVAGTHLLPTGAHADPRYADLFVEDLTVPALTVIATNLMLVLFGSQTLRYLRYRIVLPWALAGVIWWAATSALIAVQPDLAAGYGGWLSGLVEPLTATGALLIAGWVGGGVWLLGAAFSAFYRAHLPEVANRGLFWALIVPLVWMGSVAATSDQTILAEVGWAIQFLGLFGAFYSVLAYRVLDIRRTVRWTIVLLTITALTAIFFLSLLVVGMELQARGSTEPALIGTLAVLAAIFYLALQALAQQVIGVLLGTSDDGLPPLLRRYSEDIAGIVDLEPLLDVTARTVGHALHVRRAGVILVTDEDGDSGLTLKAMREGLGDIPPVACTLKPHSPILRHFLDRRAPLLQYDLAFGRAYSVADPDERQFFQQLRMSAYAPVFVQGHLVGLVCCGSKTSDNAFSRHDLEILMTIANQVGSALRNARLVDDLRRREAEQAQLNRALSTTKEQLEKLDTVKTDFITVASHELRTPLAQIRGYTDILEIMNDDGSLDDDQIASMTASLRKAADRLENLIGAMLDVSELDVDAMDLVFTENSLETLVRMAIEPLSESIRLRKLMLSARGLRSLPPIHADQQRLVQAFRNIILNAIKYTPDGGRIDITGRLQDDEIVMTIQDTGIGIEPANQSLIFEKFYRVQDPKLHSTGATKFMGGGPGLGLTIARGVIEGHGGRIWVESDGYDAEHLPGSTFVIVLPLHPPAGTRRVLPFKLAGLSGQLSTGVASASRAFDKTRVAKRTPAQPMPTVSSAHATPDSPGSTR